MSSGGRHWTPEPIYSNSVAMPPISDWEEPTSPAPEAEEVEEPAADPLTTEQEECDCEPCCCVVGVTVMGVLALAATISYLGPWLEETTAIGRTPGALFMLAVVLACVLFCRLLLVLRRADGETPPQEVSVTDYAQCGRAGDGDPPTYLQALRLPQPPPPPESPPPSYQKVHAQAVS